MPTLPTNFAALALAPGVIQDESHFLFMTTGQSGTLDLFVATATGNKPVFTLNTKAIYNGSGAPSNSIGGSGDYYIDDFNTVFYGPKGASTWPSGVALIGDTGPIGLTGPTGATGLPGTGVPTGGKKYSVLYKTSDSDRETGFIPVMDLVSSSKDSIENYSFASRANLKESDGSALNDLGSSVCYCNKTNTIFVVVDGSGSTPSIREYALNGLLIRTISLVGWYDIEAIEYKDIGLIPTNGDLVFFIAEERESVSGSASSISRITISNSTTSINKTDPGVSTWSYAITKNSPNEGIEAMCYVPEEEKLYFCLQAPVSGVFTLYKASEYSTTAEVVSDLLPECSLSEIRDMCYNRSRNSIILLGFIGAMTTPAMQEYSLFNNVVTTNGVVYLDSTLSQAEGITVDSSGESIIITGEDSVNGADLVVYNKNRLGLVKTASNKGIYSAGGLLNSINSKIFEGLDSGVFTQADSVKSIVPSLFDGGLRLDSGSFNIGNSYTVKAGGTISVIETSPGTCLLEFDFKNKVNSYYIGGLLTGNTAYFSTGTSFWNYSSNIVCRDTTSVVSSSLEIYNSTFPSYTKRISNIVTGKPVSGVFDLELVCNEGGTAVYTYQLDLHKLSIERS